MKNDYMTINYFTSAIIFFSLIQSFNVYSQQNTGQGKSNDERVIDAISYYAGQLEKTSAKATAGKYWYAGINGGLAILSARNSYSSTDNGRFVDPDWISLGYYLRFFAGKAYYDHYFEIGIENLQQVGGYSFWDENVGSGYSYDSSLPYSYISGSYFYRWLNGKVFYMNVGGHLGVGITDPLDFGSRSSSSVKNIDPVTKEFKRINFVETKRDPVVFNFGPQVRIGLKLNRRFELFLETKLMITPYKVRAYDLEYQYNDEPVKFTSSQSGIRNLNFGFGFAYNFVNRTKQKRESAELERLKKKQKKVNSGIFDLFKNPG